TGFCLKVWKCFQEKKSWGLSGGFQGFEVLSVARLRLIHCLVTASWDIARITAIPAIKLHDRARLTAKGTTGPAHLGRRSAHRHARIGPSSGLDRRRKGSHCSSPDLSAMAA